MRDLVLPTLDCDVTREHTWLQFSNEKVAVYNAHDVIQTARAHAGLIELLKRAGNWDYYRRWFRDVVPAARAIQQIGFGHLDRGRLETYRTKLHKELDDLEAGLLGTTTLFERMQAEAEQWLVENREAHPGWKAKLENGYASRCRKVEEARSKFLNSSGEDGMRARWLFDELGFKPAPKAGKRPARSTAQHALMWVLGHMRKCDEPNRQIINDLFHRSRLNTIRVRYLDVPTGPADRVYPSVRLYTAETQRWAYSDPPLHQWVPEIRHLIVPAPGHVYVACDKKQVEARIMAYFAGEKKDIEAFEDPTRDVHAETAQDLFRLSPEAWGTIEPTLKKKMRDFAKTKRYEIGYGGSGLGNQAKTFCPCPRCADKVPQMLALSPAEQRDIMKRWAVTRPATVRWQEQLQEQVVANGRRWTSPFGYTRQFAGPAKEIVTELKNFPMQHSAAEMQNRDVVELHRLGARVTLQMHDEIVLEVPTAQADESAAMLKEVMERPVPEFGGVRFPVDVHIGEDWSELK